MHIKKGYKEKLRSMWKVKEACERFENLSEEEK